MDHIEDKVSEISQKYEDLKKKTDSPVKKALKLKTIDSSAKVEKYT